jgi:putative Ca2+/H+ antiporter (TMEM165/GDT1 family)
MRHATIAILASVTVALCIYDVIAVWRGGGGSTISSVMLAAGREYPIIVLAIGVVLGHLFWSQR